MRKASVPNDGYIFRSKAEPDNFHSEVYMEEGKNIKDYYDEVPIAIYIEHQAKEKGAENGY